jgi:hypothetical protein
MAVDTSKYTMGDLYRLVSGELGSPVSEAQMALGVTAPEFRTFQFIEKVNYIARQLSGETEMLHRIYVIRPETGMMRYVKFTREEGDGGILRIDLDGQTATLPSGANDVECLGAQYEKICTGDGIDFNYVGADATPGPARAPDSFPKIYLPAEADIDPAVYNATSQLARIKGAGGLANQPSLSSLFDIQYVGWSTGDPTSDHYPTADNEADFFVDPFWIAAMQVLSITWGVNTINGAIPRSNDAYLNDSYQTISGQVGAYAAIAVIGAGTFTIDGITYTVTLPAVPPGFDFRVRLTNGANTFDYDVRSTDTPWHTVSSHSTRWGNLFNAGQDHAWYLKLDDQRMKLPDDVEKILWVWKIPKSSWTDAVDVDSIIPNTLTAVGDSEWFLYNPMDMKRHYFPVTESLWSMAKWSETFNTISQKYAGFYIQHGQQIRIYPKHTDPIGICVQCRSDLADSTTTVDHFDDIFLEIPGPAVDCIFHKILADYFASLNASGDNRISYQQSMYEQSKRELKSLYILKQGQQADAPKLRMRMQSIRHANAFGYGLLVPPFRRIDQ